MADLGSALTRVDCSAWRIACSREFAIRRLAELPKITRQAMCEVVTTQPLAKGGRL